MGFASILLAPLVFAGVLAGGPSVPPSDSLPAVLPVTLDQLTEKVREDSGHVVLVNAWASWCKPCQEELPALLKIGEEYYSRGLRLILVAIDDTEIVQNTIRPMLKTMGQRLPSYILTGTSDEAFIDRMNSEWSGALPASFLYDRKGRQVKFLVGGKTYQQFREALSALLTD